MQTRQQLIALGACLALSAAGHSADLAVNPVRITLAGDVQVAAVSVRNAGPERVVLQLQTLAWSMHDGAEDYTASDDILATPPVFAIEAGQSRVVRVGLVRRVDRARERTYRLFLQEVPAAGTAMNSVHVAVRIGIPIFVAPDVAASQLTWRAARAGEHAIVLEVTNSGTLHYQIAEAVLKLPESGATWGRTSAAGYVLPGDVRRWRIEDGNPIESDRLNLEASSDRGPIHADIPIEAD
jgi:fimbrial chaperone protein